ncbi:PRC-barrel domain-containing protein [Roseivivax sp. THAF30]|uniref:PRC-barrel domain-containing protein n=1 Tax=Roseivivax sp. THAF30 TaxID=2587852 RepID=UPI0012A8172C|nr:PRC-barrel domain-containing protein [Roseivivax sp. THAF30]QFT63625.1 PRC-barrel domain protein [Roseivivax sp. THAF30]
MTRLMTSALALTMVAGTAFAQESDDNLDDAAQNAEQAVENAGEATENAAEDAAQATENAAEDAAQATENAAEDAAQATENAAENTEQAAENAGDEISEETAEMTGNAEDAQLIRTRDITDGPVYSVNSEEGVENFGAETYEEVGSDWNQIGTIEDVVLTRSGEFRGLVIEVGGFLDLGDKHIFMEIDDVQLVPVDDRSYALAIGQSEEQLEEMEGVDEGFWN